MKGGIPPMVMVKDLTHLTLNELWKEVKDAEDWWGDINEPVLGMVKLIPEGSLEAELLEELQVSRYKRSSSKRGYRNGHYQRKQVTHPGHNPGIANPGPKPQRREILGKN